ncbi:hypothetical protein H5410_021866 [Solanum commersonii]|uniref:Uncharacterized protein n=1 Tax=Solanum commersonii TaxID=4109 RepID=A0A9J5ZCK1_SOLCO|nr:hypothetical protein H5410_021866 [Solanum commersonii]
MTEAFKRLNAKAEALLQENAKLMEQGVHSPTNAKISIVSDDKDTASPVQTVAGKDISNLFMAVTLPKSEDEGSSSRRRLARSFTQVETITKKTMLHKKKKNDKIESIIKKTLEKFFQQGQDKHVITTQNPDPSGDRLVTDIERIDTDRTNTSSSWLSQFIRPRNTSGNNITRSLSSGEEDYGEHSYYQDAQDPNEDDDS